MSAHPKQVLFPDGYVWFVFFSALDIMLTWVVLHAGGREANVLADRIIWRFGLPGLVAYKFALVVVVILICETVGRRKRETARKLLSVGIMLTCMPVVLAMALLALHR
ncbi:MAG TPA: DUF5658 family protein [Tepidisphaeraceae bacterium]|nr:DUF5658 family protein [Tepidisphaeraceae bacterium]